MSRPLVATALGGVLVAAGAGGAALLMAREAPALGPVRTLTTEGASVPTVALSPGGEGYVAWVGTRDGRSDVYLATASGGVPVRVNDRPGDAAPHDQAPAQVAVGPRGALYVLWQNNRPIAGRRFPASDLRFARSEDGGRSWSAATTVNSDRGGPPSSHTFHDLVVAPDGTLYASWLDGRARDAARARRGTGAAGGHADHGGDAGLPGSEIRVARSGDGGRSWEAEMVVDGDVCPCCRTSLAVGPDGSLHVAWRKLFQGDVRDVVVARLAPGSSRFEAPVRAHADRWVFPGCPHAGPSVAVDGAGTVHVAWYTGAEGRQGLWLAKSRREGGFEPPRPLLAEGWVPPSQVALAADGGRVLAAWDDRRVPDAAPRFGTAGGQVVSLGGAGRSPAVAAANGTVLVAWLDAGAVRVRTAPRE